MKIKLSDVFIGNFPVSQGWGERPEVYKQFGYKGHNGIDWAIPNGNQIVASHSGEVIRVENDSNGYGIHIRLWNRENKFATIYAHLQKALVNLGQKVVCGQLIGISNNTGFSTGPHLHFGVCKTDENGYRINRDNGYGGWINPLDKRMIEWDVKDLEKPVGSEEGQPIYTEEQMTGVRLERDKNWNLYQDTLKEIENVEKDNQELKSKVANLKDQISQLSKTIDKMAEEDRDCAISELEMSEKLEECKIQVKKATDRVLELEGDIDRLEEEKKSLKKRLKSNLRTDFTRFTTLELVKEIFWRIRCRIKRNST